MTYLWQATRFSADMIYGSGLRSGDFNSDHVPAYTQVNIGVAHEFNSGLEKPATLRFDVINLFDSSTRSATAPALACLPRNSGPAANSWSGYRRSFSRVRLSRRPQGAVVVAVIAVRVMQVTVDEIADVVQQMSA